MIQVAAGNAKGEEDIKIVHDSATDVCSKQNCGFKSLS